MKDKVQEVYDLFRTGFQKEDDSKDVLIINKGL
jgi:hypothetical protein